MGRRRQSVREFFRAYPFGVLLLATLVMIVGAPLTAEFARRVEGVQGPAMLAPLTILLTLASAFAVWNLARHRAVMIVAAGLVLTIIGASSVITHHALNMAHVVVQTLFLIYVTGTLVRTVFRARIVDGNILCGAACIYLLVGTLWGFGYTMLELTVPDSFMVVEPGHTEAVDLREEPGWLIYFSFTTLTTVGFGDVLPTSANARSMAVLEAVIGQIMIVVMMARLVGLHVAHATSPNAHTKFSVSEEE